MADKPKIDISRIKLGQLVEVDFEFYEVIGLFADAVHVVDDKGDRRVIHPNNIMSSGRRVYVLSRSEDIVRRVYFNKEVANAELEYYNQEYYPIGHYLTETILIDEVDENVYCMVKSPSPLK